MVCNEFEAQRAPENISMIKVLQALLDLPLSKKIFVIR